jgi:hypothetical protein
MTHEEARAVLKEATGKEITDWLYYCNAHNPAYARIDSPAGGMKAFRETTNVNAPNPLVNAANFVRRLRAQRAAEEETKGEKT